MRTPSGQSQKSGLDWCALQLLLATPAVIMPAVRTERTVCAQKEGHGDAWGMLTWKGEPDWPSYQTSADGYMEHCVWPATECHGLLEQGLPHLHQQSSEVA